MIHLCLREFNDVIERPFQLQLLKAGDGQTVNSWVGTEVRSELSGGFRPVLPTTVALASVKQYL